MREVFKKWEQQIEGLSTTRGKELELSYTGNNYNEILFYELYEELVQKFKKYNWLYIGKIDTLRTIYAFTLNQKILDKIQELIDLIEQGNLVKVRLMDIALISQDNSLIQEDPVFIGKPPKGPVTKCTITFLDRQTITVTQINKGYVETSNLKYVEWSV